MDQYMISLLVYSNLATLLLTVIACVLMSSSPRELSAAAEKIIGTLVLCSHKGEVWRCGDGWIRCSLSNVIAVRGCSLEIDRSDVSSVLPRWERKAIWKAARKSLAASNRFKEELNLNNARRALESVGKAK